MRFFTPVRMIILGIVLLVAGIVLPLLMVVKVVESTFFLNFLSYGMSMVGSIIGIAGAAFFVRFDRKK